MSNRECGVCKIKDIPYGVDWPFWKKGKPVHAVCALTYDTAERAFNFRVISVGILGGNYIEVHLPGPHSVCMTKEAAIELSAHLAFMADGNLIGATENDVVRDWNTMSKFHMAYKSLAGLV